MPLGNDGKAVPSVLAVTPCLIPKGAKNVEGAKQLLRDFCGVIATRRIFGTPQVTAIEIGAIAAKAGGGDD